MMIAPNFDLRELVSPDAFKRLGEHAKWKLDPKIVNIAQAIKNLTAGHGLPDNAVVVNNWHLNGPFKDSGFRMPNAIGAELSEHKAGRALDLKIAGMTPAQMLQLVKDNWHTLHALGLTTVEDIADTPSWLHIDCRWTSADTLLVVKGK